MLTQFIRILKNGVDVSMENAERSIITINNNQQIVLGQRYPFNNLFVSVVDEGQAVGTTGMGIEYWDGEEWIAAVDVLDFTKSFSRSGVVQFQLAKLKNWQEIKDSSVDTAELVPTELDSKNISDCYWVRIKNNGPTRKINFISYAFTTTSKINSVDVEAKSYFETFAAGKTDWFDEIVTASEMMVSEMVSSGLLKYPGQIILLDGFYLPCAWRTLAHIYQNMGKGYDDKKISAFTAYQSFLGGLLTVDTDEDARPDKFEDSATQSRLER
jgi:hypothetical protein